MNIRELFEKVEADGILTKAEIKMINDAIAEDGTVDYEERQLLEKMSEKIRKGELKQIDE